MRHRLPHMPKRWEKRISNAVLIVFVSVLSINLVTATPATGNIQALSYTYDGVGNLTQIADTSITPTAKTMTYLYDDLNRLESALSSGYASGDFGQGYSYDSIGNMTYKGGLGAMNYFGTGNPTPHAPTSVAGMPYNYSANGNLISDGVNTYTWNIKNELTSVTTPSGTWTYTYDPGGTLLTSIDPDGDTTTYVSPLMEVRPDGPVYYIYGAGQRLAKVTGDMATGGDLTTLHPDHLGSTAVTTDETGTVAELLDYYPYGEELAASASYSSAPETAYTFGGKEHTEDTGLSYFEARHYKPSIGKFISMDPFPRRAPEYMLPDPQSWNSYAYARNNPLVYTDPSGEYVETALDVISLALSSRDFAINPSLGTGFFVGLDIVGTSLPVPSPGLIKHGPRSYKIMKYFKEIASETGKSSYSIAKTFAKNIFFQQTRRSWTQGNAGDSLGNLVGHFAKHGDDVGASDVGAYYNKANDFLDSGEYKTWKEGGTNVNYNPDTNTAVYTDAKGNIQSMYTIKNVNKYNQYQEKAASIK